MRYIDADLIPYSDDDDYLSQYAYRYDINEVPTADVVPKSEVEYLEREVRLLTENSITAKYPHCVLGSYYAVLTKSLEDYDKVIADISSEAKAEVAREIFEEISKASVAWGCYCVTLSKGAFLAEDVNRTLAELKKKYQEGDS